MRGGGINRLKTADSVTTDDTTSYVKVGELFDSDTKTFNQDNYKILLKYLTGDANATIATATALAETNNNQYASSGYVGTDASVLRAKTLSAGTQGSTSYAAKTAEQDINVRLGGLDWTVTYLSQDINGNTIATLWLDDSYQEAWVDLNGNYGDYYFSDGNLVSVWNPEAEDNEDEDDEDYEDEFDLSVYKYDWSYVHSTTLNRISSVSEFALFVISDFGLKDYLATPRSISWQKNQDSIGGYGSSEIYNLNEGWSLQSTTGDDWEDSYLWLPSYSETCVVNSVLGTGLWCVSDKQKEFTSCSFEQYDDNDNTLGYDAYNTWLRTVRVCEVNGSVSSAAVFYIESNGETYRYTDCTYLNNTVRPALHLNLTKIHQLFSETNNDSVKVGELFDSNTKTFNKDNYNILLKYLSSNDSAIYATVKALAEANVNQFSSKGYVGTDASIFRASIVSAGVEGGTSYSVKSGNEDICVKLGGLDWQVTYLSQDINGNTIATLWLDDSQQEAWEERASDEGLLYGFDEGLLYSQFTGIWGSTAKAYSDENGYLYQPYSYGMSYVNAVTLNNGGVYANANATNGLDSSGNTIYKVELITADKSNSSVFALFTMPEYGLTNFLITPNEVSWQECQDRSTIMSVITGTYDTYKIYNESFGSSTKYTSRGHENWKDSYLWLPSVSEVYYLWNTSIAQKRNGDGSINNSRLVGSYYSDDGRSYRNDTLLRSAHGSSPDPVIIKYSGYSSSVSFSGAIRPALHLNLSAIYEALNAEDLSDGKGTISVSPASDEYDGSAKTPTIRVKYNGVTLAKDVDYTLSYTFNGVTVSEFKEVGVYTITATGKRLYKGSVSGTYTIKQTYSLSDGKGRITVDPAKEMVTGTARAPTIMVTYNGVTLTKDVDYTLSYTMNGAAKTELRESGIYTITATGAGQYRDSISASYVLESVQISGITLLDQNKVVVFRQSEGSPRLCLHDGDRRLLEGVDYSVTNTIDYNALSGSVVVTGLGGYSGTKTYAFTLALLDPLAGVYVAIFA